MRFGIQLKCYNHITNNWGDVPHDIPFDVRGPHSNQFMHSYLKQWLKDNPDTDCGAFYNVLLSLHINFQQLRKRKICGLVRIWCQRFSRCTRAFAKEKGYRLRAEDIVDEGYYNSTFRTPSKAYLDYIDFIQAFVAREAKN